MAEDDQSGPECNECGEQMDWGEEYPDPRGGITDDDHDALCSEHYYEIPVGERHP